MKRILAYFFGGSKENKTIDGDGGNRIRKLSSKNNWIGPDGTESGPDVSEDWYLTYDGPAPIVEDVYEPNYAVDRGNGAIPITFYINKWGVPDGFGNTELEKSHSSE